MNEFTDKLLLLVCSFTLYVFTGKSDYAVVPVLITVFLSCLSMYFESLRIRVLLYLVFLAVSLAAPSCLLFLPVMLYDLLFTDMQFCLFACFPVLGLDMDSYPPVILLLLLLFCAVCYILKLKVVKFGGLLEELHVMQDSAAELSLVQVEKNRSILENQDYEINVATLNERNRISKEIHDHVGHLLSRSLLQIGALLTIAKEDSVREGLSDLKASLSEGMDSIRASIHNMHDESVDLYAAIQGLTKSFSFCPVLLDYDVSNPPLLKLKYCLIAVVKESLSNIAKHSDADKASVSLKEQPGLYQLVISDNGHVDEKTAAMIRRGRLSGEYTEGMGLQNIWDRVKGFRGNINITTEHGFQLFITIPKGEL